MSTKTLNLLDVSRLFFDVNHSILGWEDRGNETRADTLSGQLEDLRVQCEDDFGHDWPFLAGTSDEFQIRRVLSPRAVSLYERLLDMVENPWRI